MNRQDIVDLAVVRGYPCLTITLPTHRTSPDNRQDPIRLKNLVTEATNRLTGELGKREVAAMLRLLEEATADIDHEHNLDGMAIFVNAEMTKTFRLPFTLPERVVVDETFFVRDLIYALNRSPRYWVLALSEQQTRLFEAVRDDLEELRPGTPFPMSNPNVSSGRPGPKDVSINYSLLRDEYSRAFFRDVDQALGTFMTADPLPLALAGVDRNIAFFREVTRYPNQIIATLTGNYDATSGHDLGKLIWPLVRESLDARRMAIFGELNAAVGAQRSASTIGEVWRFAHEGRGATLVVEENYHEPALIDPSDITGNIQLNPGELVGPEALDDAVDAVIVKVLEKSGRVVFVDDGALPQHGRIALILRY